MKSKEEHQVGDLFVTKDQILLKLLPSKKTASKPIQWFEDGVVTDHHTAVKDISGLVEQLKRRSDVIRGLTLMTDRGLDFDVKKSGLTKVVQKAGYKHLN